MTATGSPDLFRPLLGRLPARIIFVEGPGNAAMTDQERFDALKYISKGADHIGGCTTSGVRAGNRSWPKAARWL
jgi:hypothetical protein